MRSANGMLADGTAKVGGHKSALTIVIVVADYNLLYLSIFTHFAPEILVEGVEMILQLAGVHLVLRIIGRVLIEIWEENGLRVGWLYMFPRASVAVSACADFVIERAVDFVLLCSKDRGKVAGIAC